MTIRGPSSFLPEPSAAGRRRQEETLRDSAVALRNANPRELPSLTMRVFAVIVITVESRTTAKGKTSGVLSLDENSRGKRAECPCRQLGYAY